MDYHTLSTKDIIEKFNSSKRGLDNEEVNLRLRKYGENKLVRIRHFNALKIFLSQFKSFLIIILIFAAVLSILMHSIIDSVVIFAILLINAGLGFSQEYKAEKAIEELKKMMVPVSKVLRNGKLIKINSKNIVPGDILILREGDKIMADARILESDGLKVNESALTGESVADEKYIKILNANVPLADRTNMVYQGTQVVIGSAKAMVVDTGMRTELGKISELVQKVKSEQNPFKKKLDSFAKKIGIFILILAAIIVGIMLLEGGEIFNSLLVAVSLAVSAIPEGLPAVISLGLAFATKKMMKKNVLIRKLPASETLGRVTVICTDKTGTITEEEMKVTDIYANGKLNPEENKELLLKIGILCNKARIERNEQGEYFIGDPTEKALIISAKNNFLDKKELTEKEPKVKEFAFSSERKMMSVVRKSDRKFISYVKGAPETIIKRCGYELINQRKVKLDEKAKQKLIKVYEEMAKNGLRVLGFAYKEIPGFDKQISQEKAEQDLVFVGLQGMIDPPRKEVKDAIEMTKQAGIKVIMITGDSKLTAEAVAKEIGLKGKSIDSEQLQEMSDKDLFNQISDISVFSRISPEDKLRIINVLKQKNEIIAMTGDGVNDAPALKRADIGIAMGVKGTDVARDSSDVILLDDNFASIVEGVKQGRGVYDNVKKFIKFLLASNFDEVLLVLLVMLIWRNPELLPMLPLQILWINLITDSLPALALSIGPIEKGIMKRKPNKQGILKGITGFIVFAGFIAFLICFLFFYLNIEDINLARTMVVTSCIMFEMLLVFNCQSNKSVFKSKINKWLIYAVLISVVFQIIAIYTPLGGLFGFVMLGVYDWVKIIGMSFLGFFIMEGFKFYSGRKLKA